MESADADEVATTLTEDEQRHAHLQAPLGEVVAMQGLAAQFASGKYGKLRAVAGIIHRYHDRTPHVVSESSNFVHL